MANNDIAVEYTEDKYCSRSEASKKFGFQFPDLMWKKVLDYRSNFNHSLALKWFSNNQISLCLYPTYSSRINQIEAKLNRLFADVNKLDKTNGNYRHYKMSCLKNSLKELIEYHQLNVDEDRLAKVIVSENPFDNDEEKVVNYLSALRYTEERYVNNIDIDFLAELYSRVTGIQELTYFYRENNIDTIGSTALISRIYDAAPYQEIESMMESLFDFIKNSNLPVLTKGLVTYYYTLIVRPFRDYNEEIAVLLMKAVLAHFAYGEDTVTLNLESFISEKKEVIRKINNDVQQYNDMTYALSEYVMRLDFSVNEALNLIKEYTANEIKNDFFRLDDSEEKQVVNEEPIEEQKEEVIPDEPVVYEEPIKEEPVKEVAIEEVKEEKPHVEIVETKPVNKVKKENKVEVVEEVKDNPAGVAIRFIPNELDEKTASRLAEHLLEMDVMLKKGEAYFYARHCTLGMYYTIDQYKKSVKCVYETARTSMEHLVQLGYYSKKQVGKKFVYTPVERK